ncbi:pyridoxal phosphate-dependent aminotransferase [Chryseobacterium lactis]|uniref:Pyridoxal phosphate-dependent aminotransferase n=1 Tax=Chryseobacterium lactis TaxID=1241981 RepID=A0A3G6RVK6_CHRLC|nr:DegT/DnrJ/EryC1/StrS family aminotransferase [Chryseobacterium lactis]AZA85012.1 pyridoxal phosphate-dependent aminotransferase [Chryseobacterium lactis]AZB07239.1 pyridoxal phosphate-dependent aminotransferase [Chryseobacterium lactis]PNW11585.1 pyridoxal phosphate-dependent aminotransferase [Chryseobacterium lactis]
MGGNELKYIQDAFDTNWISQYGSNINEFESVLENYLGNNSFVTALSSGTAAIHLALRLLNVEEDDFVICQSFTFVASANPVLYQKAIPVFVDSETSTWNLCPNALEDAIKYCLKQGKKPKAIITVSLYGMPFMVDEILEISRRYEIPIIEDSAEALGSTYKDKPCGTFGDLSVTSFNGNKIITTSGGGILVSRNQKYKDEALYLATQAKENRKYYSHSEVGYNYRMSNISAGIGRGQMEVLKGRISKRRENHDFYKEIFKNWENINLFEEPGKDFFSNYWLNTITIEGNNIEITKENLKRNFSENNIETRYLWKPMHLQPLFEKYKFFGSNVCGIIFDRGLCLPSGTNLTDGDKDKIRNILISFRS